MNRQTMILSLAALGAMMLSSCNNAPKANDTARAIAPQATELKIAYVEADSIMTQYLFAKESQESLQKKEQNIQNTITSKEQAVNSAMAKLQQDVQSNLLTQEQAEQRYAAIQKQYNEVQTLGQRLYNEWQAEKAKLDDAVSDSIQHFIEVYNKDKKFSFILIKGVTLYADAQYDITDEVVAGLNKAYKPKKKDSEESK